MIRKLKIKQQQWKKLINKFLRKRKRNKKLKLISSYKIKHNQVVIMKSMMMSATKIILETTKRMMMTKTSKTLKISSIIQTPLTQMTKIKSKTEWIFTLKISKEIKSLITRKSLTQSWARSERSNLAELMLRQTENQIFLSKWRQSSTIRRKRRGKELKHN